MQNQCLNYIRDKKVEDRYRDRAEVVSEDFFYNTVLEEEIFIRLQQAIEELPEKFRKVINLNLEGLIRKLPCVWEYLLMLLNSRKRGGKSN